MYWKKKPSQNTNGANPKNQLPVENEYGLPASHYEMSNREPLPSTSCTLVSVKATALDEEKNEDGLLNAEMS